MEFTKLAEIQQFLTGKSVHDVFNMFKSRRAAIIKALTSEYQQFYTMCDPAKDNLCLYGHLDEKWSVRSPCDNPPSIVPEPVTGINFARDEMPKSDWVDLIAAHSNAWLVAWALHIGGVARFNRLQREQLFEMMNDLPTVPDVVKEFEKQSKAKNLAASNPEQRSSRAKSNKKGVGKYAKRNEGGGGDEETDEDYWCGVCGKIYKEDEFWILCDACETWFHGKCVKVTPTGAELIDRYVCPLCSNMAPRR